MIHVGLIGLGYWGPNYLRILGGFDSCEVSAIADMDKKRLEAAKKSAPSAKLYTKVEDVAKDSKLDAVVVATPTKTHFEIGKQILKAGKHLLIEKPLTLKSDEARELVDIAKQKKVTLMVGHTFLFNPGVKALKELISKKELGTLLYFNSVRANLGPIRQDVNVLVDLAPHDISILLYLLGQMPESVSAQGSCYLSPDREDVAYINLHFPKGVMAQINVSWLEPVKVRRVTAIGDKKMAVFNDIDVVEPIRIYDKGVSFTQKSYADFAEFRVIIREGGVFSPKIPFAEPLKQECLSFLEAIEKGKESESNGEFGHRVVQVIEAAQKSIGLKGERISIG